MINFLIMNFSNTNNVSNNSNSTGKYIDNNPVNCVVLQVPGDRRTDICCILHHTTCNVSDSACAKKKKPCTRHKRQIFAVYFYSDNVVNCSMGGLFME